MPTDNICMLLLHSNLMRNS